jgi:glycerophosphoryl diester phosphodiesterase
VALAVAAGGLLSVSSPSPARAAGAPLPNLASTSLRAVVEDPSTPAALGGPATALTPLVADFDGDGRTDVLWYGPGSLPDHLWLGRPGRELKGVPVSIKGSYEPVVGDFDGDGRADIFWYAAGAAADVMWLGRAGGAFAGRSASQGGTFQPIPGDFDGNGRTDILWYGVGAAVDQLWLAASAGYFRHVSATISGTYRPVVGDFDGDGPVDILWYGSGGARDVVWYGAPSGVFRGRTSAVDGTYDPVVGDFDGDGRRDILWYGTGASGDVIWYGRGARGFTGRTLTILEAGTPVTGDFNGDGRRDVLVHGAGVAPDRVLYGRYSRGFDGVAVTANMTAAPVTGDFAGDGRGDVFWYAAGNPRDYIWAGYGRAFTGYATTIDIGFTRALPLRPEVVNDQFNPYGFIGHAMGGIDGYNYTNTLEAFESNYARGFRVFECDQVVLADGTVVVAHDGIENLYGLDKKFAETTWEEMKDKKYRGRYTVLRAEDLVLLMARYPDAYFILDFKIKAVEAFATYVRLVKSDDASMERLIPHVADPTMLAAMRAHYPVQNYMVALYRTQAFGRQDDPEVLAWARSARIPALMMWHRQRDFSISLSANHSRDQRYDAGFVDSLRRAGTVPYVHTVNDKAKATWLWDNRIGVYTDFLFPPFEETPPPTSSAQRSGQPAQPVAPYVGDEG